MSPTPADALNLSSGGLVKFDGTSVFSASSITQYATLVGGASNAVSNIGPGTAGQVFLSGGNAANPAFVTPTGGTGISVTANASTLSFALSGGLVLIQSQTASSSASISFTSGVSGYNSYLLLMTDVVPSSGTNVTLNLQLSSNGGSSYINSGYESGINNIASNGTVTTTTTSTSSFIFTNRSSTQSQSIVAYLFDITNGNYPSMKSEGAIGASGSNATNLAAGAYTVNTTMNAFQLAFSSGNITSGTFSLYGIL